MGGRRIAPRRGVLLTQRGALPADLSVRDAWSVLGAIREIREEHPTQDEKPHRAKIDPVHCSCDCRCGMRTTTTLCYLCGQGIHHRCGRGCKPFNPEYVTANGLHAWTQYLPERRACNGGRPLG